MNIYMCPQLPNINSKQTHCMLLYHFENVYMARYRHNWGLRTSLTQKSRPQIGPKRLVNLVTIDICPSISRSWLVKFSIPNNVIIFLKDTLHCVRILLLTLSLYLAGNKDTFYIQIKT